MLVSIGGSPARCYGNAGVMGIVNSCRTIMDKMDVSDQKQLFERGHGADVELPYVLNSGKLFPFDLGEGVAIGG